MSASLLKIEDTTEYIIFNQSAQIMGMTKKLFDNLFLSEARLNVFSKSDEERVSARDK